MLHLIRKLLKMIEESSKRSAEEEQQKKKANAGAPQELQDDDDDEEDEDEEETLRRTCEEALGAVMEVCPDFVNAPGVLQEVTDRMKMWLSTKQHKTLGLFLA